MAAPIENKDELLYEFRLYFLGLGSLIDGVTY